MNKIFAHFACRELPYGPIPILLFAFTASQNSTANLLASSISNSKSDKRALLAPYRELKVNNLLILAPMLFSPFRPRKTEALKLTAATLLRFHHIDHKTPILLDGHTAYLFESANICWHFARPGSKKTTAIVSFPSSDRF